MVTGVWQPFLIIRHTFNRLGNQVITLLRQIRAQIQRGQYPFPEEQQEPPAFMDCAGRWLRCKTRSYRRTRHSGWGGIYRKERKQRDPINPLTREELSRVLAKKQCVHAVAQHPCGALNPKRARGSLKIQSGPFHPQEATNRPGIREYCERTWRCCSHGV